MAEESDLISKKVLYLWLFALGTSASLSDSSCSSKTSFLLLLRASALRMLVRTLWCSGGSMLFTSSNLEEQQAKSYRPASVSLCLLLADAEKKHVSPKLSDELGEDIFQFGPEVSPHVVLNASDAFHLSTESSLR